ncbi:hypothetical protein BSKO_06129 [Bryopsis sp. KO-2023]|nr:hypothetical protein BSKO_06129 [Bryopsis sp. KO-2023]
MLRLLCQAQNYAWGRPGDASEVASLCEANGEDVDKSKPYAELWMGTHPSGPSKTAPGGGGEGETLEAWITAHSDSLGKAVVARFGKVLPFLFKVLSVRTALSIQSHPDKKLAERLHAERPNVYKDPNHKPEMAIALHDFQALCRFVSHEKLVEAVKSNPELRACIGERECEDLLGQTENKKQALKEAFTKLMTCEKEIYSVAVEGLVARLQREAKSRTLSDKENLVLILNEQYPSDVGVLAAFFLNLVKLDPGQAIYLPANEPHAYVSGELVECMAASDNVVRAGLTPKLRDTEVLCSSLTYDQGIPQILEGDVVNEHVKSYRPPFDEFEVQSISVPGGTSATLPVNQGPIILLVQKGTGQAKATAPMSDTALETDTKLSRGNVFFVPAGTSLEVSTDDAPLLMWAACVNQKVVDGTLERSNIVPAPLQTKAAGVNVE